jgi:hypothetical protein
VARILANLRVIYQRNKQVDSLRWAVKLRCAMPGASAEDRLELTRLMAPLN